MLIVGFMREQVFKPWARFALPWVLVMMFFSLVTPNTSPMFGPSEQGLVALFLLALYILISLLIILIQSVRVYWLKK
jgi:hypothetical protein